MRKEEEKNQGEIGEIGRELSSLANLIGELEELTDAVDEGLTPMLYDYPTKVENEEAERQTNTLIGDELYKCNRRICAVVMKLKSINERNAL